jgi:tetratricopeptide (TPR) repeat protein
LNDPGRHGLAVPDAENPWPGLHEFDERGKDFFNGREKETADLVRLVDDAPLTVLFGASGLGKTSLLLAGLTPRLRLQNMLPVYIRIDPRNRNAPLIVQATEAFRRELRAHEVEDHPPLTEAEPLWEYLHRADLELWSGTNHLLTPVLIFDQFEEVFTLGDENRAAVERFREDLADLIENRVPAPVATRFENPAEDPSKLELTARRARFVLSFREDFLPDVESWRKDIPSLTRNWSRLFQMTGQQAMAAVVKTGGALVDPKIAERIVRFAAAAEPRLEGRGPNATGPAVASTVSETAALSDLKIEPALLSMICTGLNDRRRSAEKQQIDEQLLDETGPEIIEDFYESCVRDLREGGRNFIEEKLITESGYRNPFPRDDAIARGDLSEEELERLVKRRLLRVEHQLGTDRIEIIHDVLTKVVRTFRDRQRATKREAEREEALRRLAAERDESKRVARRRLYGLVAAFALFVVASGSTLIAVVAWRSEQAAFKAYKEEQQLRHESEAARQQLALEKSHTDALEAADMKRAEALSAASRKDYDGAVRGLTEALSTYEHYHHQPRMVRARVDRGNVYVLSDRKDLAEKDIEYAVELAKQTGTPSVEAIALEAKAALHEQSGAPDTAALYRQAEDRYRPAGDSHSVARIQEWRATRAERERDFASAVVAYRQALERYRLASDAIGVARIDGALRRTTTWAFLVDLKSGAAHPLRGDRAHIGRNSEEVENDVDVPGRYISRRQLMIAHEWTEPDMAHERTDPDIARERFKADDERSQNGTVVNAANLRYGSVLDLSDGDIITLAGRAVFQLRMRDATVPAPPTSAWAIFIDGQLKSYTYLTAPVYSVALTSVDLRLVPGDDQSAVAKLRYDQKNAQFYAVAGAWTMTFEYKKNDHEYGYGFAPSGKWLEINNLAPSPAFPAKLSPDGQKIIEKGPAFQVILTAPDNPR